MALVPWMLKSPLTAVLNDFDSFSKNFCLISEKKRRFGRAKTTKISIEKMKEKAEEKEQ